MVRLIRCVTENNSGIFDTQLNAIINIKPNSQIALSNLSCDSVFSAIEITPDNNTITYQLVSEILTAKLTTGVVYVGTDVEGLFADITNKLNQELDVNKPAQIGTEFRASIDGLTKKFVLDVRQYRIGGKFPQLPNWTLNSVENSAAPSAEPVLQSTRVSADTRLSNMYNPTPIARGGGLFRISIGQLGNSVEGLGFDIGITKEVGLKTPNFVDGNVYGAIRVKYLTGVYEYWDGNEWNETETIIVATDEIEIGLVKGAVQLAVTKVGDPTNTRVVLHAFPKLDLAKDDLNTELYPFIAFRDGTDAETPAKVTSVRFTETMFPRLENGEYSGYDTNNVIQSGALSIGASQQTRAIRQQLGLTRGLADYLGYRDLVFPSIVSTFPVSWNADTRFDPVDYSDSFMVEMLNLQLECYDGQTKERRNILAVIPQAEQVTQDPFLNRHSQIVYEANNLIYLNLTNANEISLRNIQLRILKNNGETLRTRGLCVATILIKDDRDRN
jgi:hypothetical protein